MSSRKRGDGFDACELKLLWYMYGALGQFSSSQRGRLSARRNDAAQDLARLIFFDLFLVCTTTVQLMLLCRTSPLSTENCSIKLLIFKKTRKKCPEYQVERLLGAYLEGKYFI